MPWTWLEKEWPKVVTILMSVLGGIWGARGYLAKHEARLVAIETRQEAEAARLKELEVEHDERVAACPGGQVAEIKKHIDDAAKAVAEVEKGMAYQKGLLESQSTMIAAMHDQMLRPKRRWDRRDG